MAESLRVYLLGHLEFEVEFEVDNQRLAELKAV